MLSTCNRTELYLAAENDDRLGDRADEALLVLAGTDAGALAPSAYRLGDESAALHLFRVAAGLDSLVPGEGEILGQVRDAFEAGSPGPLLDRTFRMALHAGRRARVETAIGESPASVPSAAAALASRSSKGSTAVVSSSSAPAGRRADRAQPPLAGSDRGGGRQPHGGACRAAGVLTRRSRGRARPARRRPRGRGRRRLLHERARVRADAGGARPDPARTSRPAGPVRRPRGPADVDPALAAIDGCFVYDVDDLEAVVSSSLEGRRAEAVHAERIVAAEAERFRGWQASLTVVPAIASLRARAEEIRAAELARVESRLGRLSEGDRAVVETVTAQIVAKLLHLPTVRMKEAAVAPDGLVYADVVRHLFGLGEEDES